MDVKRIERKVKALQRQLQKNDHVRSKLDTYILLADLYQKLGAFEDQIEWLTRAYGVLKRRRTPSEIRFNVLMSFIAAYRIFESEKAYSLGLKYADLALDEATALQNHAFEQKARHQKAFYLISYSSENEDNLSEAEVLLNQMLVEGEFQGNTPDFRSIAYVHLGIISRYRENLVEANRYFNLTLEFLPPNSTPERKASIYKSVAKFYIHGEKNLKKAKPLLLESLELGSWNFSQIATLQELESISLEEGDFQSAHQYLNKRIELERKWNMEKAETKMTAMKVKGDLLDAKRKRKIFELENVKLAEANRKIAEKNKHITDSITYSSRLQDAVLPTEDELREAFGDHFIFYRPKDIVAGDFYWFQKTANYYYFAVADCTGHGVPGAMVSMICHNALTESVQKLNEPETDKVLENARRLVKLFFNSEINGIRDGMDICLVRIGISDPTEIQYSGAHNSLLVINELGEANVVKADRQPVGSWLRELPFTATNVEVSSGSRLFLYSDGMPDQFGGPNNTKLKTSAFNGLLIETSGMPLAEQGERIKDFFTDWLNGGEQMDDVTVVGIAPYRS